MTDRGGCASEGGTIGGLVVHGIYNGKFSTEGETARYLFRQYASKPAILDYHLPFAQRHIGDRRFNNLFEICLRATTTSGAPCGSNGVAERYCTGECDPYEKFLAWAKTVPSTLRNPLYHWTHLELLRYF